MKKYLCMMGILLCVAVGEHAFAQVHLAVSMPDLDNARQVAVASDIVQCAEQQGYEVEVSSANGELSKQISDIREMLAKHPSYLVVVSTKSIGLRRVIAEAAAQGVKVLMVDNLSSDVSPQDILANISIDAVWAGNECARVLAAYFDGKPAKILEIQGEAGSWSTYRFTKGFRDALCAYQNIEIFSVLSGSSDRQNIQQSLLKLLESMDADTGFDAVFCHNDEGGLGTVNAYLSSIANGYMPKEGPVVVIGGSADTMRALSAERLYACIYTMPYYGQVVVSAIEKDRAGEAIDHEQIIPGSVLYAYQTANQWGY